MNIGEMLQTARSRAGISQKELAEKLKVPVSVIVYIESPEAENETLIELLAAKLDTDVDVFRGEKEPEPTEEELAAAEEAKRAEAAAKAKYPAIRAYMLHPDRCASPSEAESLFGGESFPLAEKNLVLYLSTTALYEFCDTHASTFSFDEYLFMLHGSLLDTFEADLRGQNLTAEEKDELLNNARTNVFCCDTMENIAIRVLESFAAELEEKLIKGERDFEDDIGTPFTWEIDSVGSKITFRNTDGSVMDEVKLLDVKKSR